MRRPDDGTMAAVAAASEQFPADGERGRVVFGFDGYVDSVREVVDDRRDPEAYDRLDTLSGFSGRVDDSVAADSSLSFEWIQRGTRTGGHTCHLGRAFGEWGFDPAMFGMYGDPVLERFAEEFGEYDLYTLGEPGRTDAVEFDDGKLMLTENGDSMELDWETVVETVGRDTVADHLDGAALLGVGYWAETPDLPAVVDGLCDLWPALDDPPETVLLDPGDVRKLDAQRLQHGRNAFASLDDVSRVVLSANRAETAVLADVYGESGGEGADALADARAVFDAVSVDAVVSHGVDRSVVVTDGGATGVHVPVADDPELTTSAGDHFNAGLALALIERLDHGPAVAVGNAVAGQFVRTGEPPSRDEIRRFLAEYESYF